MKDPFRWLTANPTPIPHFLRDQRIATTLIRSRRLAILYQLIPKEIKFEIFSSYYRQTDRFFKALSRIEHKSNYFEGCKSVLRAQLIVELYPETKIVHLIKNPYAYLDSCIRRVKKPYRSIVNGWVNYHNNAKDIGDHIESKSYLQITFEELTKTPQETVEKVYDFIGVPQRSQNIDQWVDPRFIHVVGSRSKNVFKTVEEKEPRWKKSLTADQMKYIHHRIERMHWIKPLLPKLDWHEAYYS